MQRMNGVLYEKTLKSMQTREFTSQMISPPIVLNLSMREAELLNTYMDRFTRIGFEIEEFGQDSYAVRAVPDNLFSIAKKELLIQMLDSLRMRLPAISLQISLMKKICFDVMQGCRKRKYEIICAGS